MPTNLLAQLNLDVAQSARLPAKARTSLLRFLLRWEGEAEVLACLDALAERRPLVSLMDMRAQALVGVGRANEAVQLMRQRVAQNDSTFAQILTGRCLLAAGQPKSALRLGAELAGQENAPTTVWTLLGDAYLVLGDLAQAETAYMRHLQLAPNSRPPALGLARLYLQRGEQVTAAAYAVRAYAEQEDGYDAQIYLIRELREFFAQSGDVNRQRDAADQLQNRLAQEIGDLQALLAQNQPTPGSTPTRTPTARSGREQASLPPPPPPLPDLDTVPVSLQERRELKQAAQQLFGFPSLLEAQTEIMACTRRGENVLAVLPTGGGKSLCYQLPAFMDSGVTLVVSPLIALMKDQLDNLPAPLQNKAVAINSTLDGRELHRAIREVAQGHYRLVYAAPERLTQLPFLQALRQGGVNRLVIDEAHCVSVWGHDFRPDYLRMTQAHRELGRPPILAMTATAPPRVRADIEQQLFGVDESNPVVRAMRLIATDTFRPNLTLSAIQVRNEDERLQQLVALCHSLTAQDAGASGIIYARTRRRCEELAGLLRQQGLQAEHYHAGMADRSAVQDRFMQDQTRIIVATVAFGMGVDKPDIRFILHHGLPDSVEAYYQEAGRAGRDGQPAHCILLWSSHDQAILTRNVNRSLLGVDFLRRVYASVRSQLGEANPGPVTWQGILAASRSDENRDDTQARVGLSILEQVGLIQRHYDLPRTVELEWNAGSAENSPPLFQRFVQAAGLTPQQAATRGAVGLAAATGIALNLLEVQLLNWLEAGLLDYTPGGRDLLITLLDAPPDATGRVERLLDRYATIQQQRVTEIVDYARTTHCRHGHLANYLGGLPRPQCTVCANCGAPLPLGSDADPSTHLPPDADQIRLVLTALSEGGWGRRNLVRLLRGDSASSERAQKNPAFASLGFRSETSLNGMVDELVHEGHIEEAVLSHGGVALKLTQTGWQIVRG